ncbi:DUF6318 family protein [Blastococcus sp. TF02A_35]|uniref:DUF6318 family protein n=1 Tax=Blastococcus sp. TF02A-35 TaxID=2559612 RepID=UPI0010741565|nr:DUF6318 family protein [Blastococcus sp. TF02A_35]TFV47796.1 hypothetical protein E4P43_14785 [Blastococcus sp. TF02A_35]
MRDLRGLRRTLTAAALAALVLGGCSEKQEANDTLPTAAPETTESLPPVGPAEFPVPDEARTKDAAGAEAFLKYWIDLINRQRSIPDGAPLRDLGPECQNCQRIAQNYDEAAAAGTRYQGGAVSIDDAAKPTLADSEVTISFLASQAAVQRLDSSGAPIDAGQPSATGLSSGISLRWSDNERSWLVESFDLG